jgi:hypothetical protein
VKVSCRVVRHSGDVRCCIELAGEASAVKSRAVCCSVSKVVACRAWYSSVLPTERMKREDSKPCKWLP